MKQTNSNFKNLNNQNDLQNLSYRKTPFFLNQLRPNQNPIMRRRRKKKKKAYGEFVKYHEN